MKFILLFLVLFQSAFAQVIEAPLTVIDYQQNPSDIVWRHIETEHFDIIFPEEIEAQAQRVAHLLEKAYPYVTRSLETLPPKIPLILQNQSVQSNGFVTLAPRRSEWYVSPAIDPELTNTEWLKTLSVHEFRHVVQFQKTRRGFNKFLYVVMGEVGQALGVGLTIPPWFLEGDAVGTETALTKGGRGRLPLFDRDLRTLLLSGKEWNYDKAHMGSFEDYIPNHYVYGYFYTSYLRNMYGDLFLSELTDESAERSWNPLSFYNSTHKLTGKKFESFYRHVMRDLTLEWKKRADALKPTPYDVKNLGKKFGWTNYSFPQVTSTGDILALKRGLSFINQFVLLDGKKEKTLFYPGPLVNEYPYRLRGEKIAYVEYEVDPRWGYRDFTRLRVYDLAQKKFVLNKGHTKFRTAILDQEGKNILVTEWDENQGQFILILNKKGKEILRMPYKREEVITSLDWINEDEIIMVTKDHDDMKTLVKLNLKDRSEVVLIQKNVNNIGNVVVEEGNILYESPESGIDNIWTYTQNGPRQITSALFGAYSPDLKNGKLTYNDYTVSGMNIVTKSLPWEEEQKSENSFYPVYEKFAQNEDALSLDKEFKTEETFESKPYSQIKNAPNLHSWLLLAPPLGNSVVVEGFSRDVLNKLNMSAGGIYNLNEQTLTGFATATWSHLYPVFDIRGGYGNRREDVQVSANREVENKWEEGTFEASAQVPWRFIQGRFVHSFSAKAFAKVIKVTNRISADLTEVNDGALYSPGGEVTYSVLQRTARRDLLPKLGFMVKGHLEDGRDITGTGQKGSIRSVDAKLFLPGVWYHHSFYHQLAYEKQKDDTYQYASYILYPRGTKSVFLEEFTKYSANYTMPLFYPDWNLSRYLYVKRISLNLFYDDLKGTFRIFDYRASSFGWETMFDMNFVRIFIPFGIGLRGSYVIEGAEKDSNYELFLTTVLGTF